MPFELSGRWKTGAVLENGLTDGASTVKKRGNDLETKDSHDVRDLFEKRKKHAVEQSIPTADEQQVAA